MRRLAFLGLCLLCAGASRAHGAAVLSSWEFVVDGLGEFHLQGQLDRFEPTQGTLRQVCLGLTAEAGVSVEFNREGAPAAGKMFSTSARIRGGVLGIGGDGTARTFVDVPSSPQRGSQAATAELSARAEFTADQWREFLSGLGVGDTIEFDVQGNLTASISGAKVYDRGLDGQALSNEVRGVFYVKYVFDSLVEGDANGDGWVNLGDFALVKTAFGATGDEAEVGDLTGDGIVDLSDFGQLKVAMAGRPVSTPVPEPATLGLGLIGVLALLACRARRSRLASIGGCATLAG